MTIGLVRGAAFAAILVATSTIGLAETAPPAAVGSNPSKPDEGTKSDTAKPDVAKPDVATLLFGIPQWDNAPPGAKLRYTYEKTTSDASLGRPFKDEVVLTLGAGDDPTSRTTQMQLFSGMNRLPAGPFRSDQQNPVLLVILEDNVQELSKLFKANPRYLKNAIRKSWRTDPTIESAEDVVDGKPTRVTRVSVTPFVHDKEADKMEGLADLTYVVDVSKDVPGYIVAIDIRAPKQGKALFAETLRFASETKP